MARGRIALFILSILTCTRGFCILKNVRVYNYSVYHIYFFTRVRFRADEFIMDCGVHQQQRVVAGREWAKKKVSEFSKFLTEPVQNIHPGVIDGFITVGLDVALRLHHVSFSFRPTTDFVWAFNGFSARKSNATADEQMDGRRVGNLSDPRIYYANTMRTRGSDYFPLCARCEVIELLKSHLSDRCSNT